MTEKNKAQREELIKKWKEKYKDEIESCLDEAEKFARTHPYARKCVIRRKRRPEEFRIALIESCEEKEMGVAFGWFGIIEIWFDRIEFEGALW